MRVDNLSIHQYRNYQNLTLAFNDNINIFIGNNAQGKTNLLESLYLGAFGRSHRTTEDDDLISWDGVSCSVEIHFTRHGVSNKLSFRIRKGHRKEIMFNDFVIKPREVVGSLNAVLFSPEDLWLVKGVPALRRRFLDGEISQAVPSYYYKLLQYQRILNQRNNLLKKIREKKAVSEQLATWDEQLANSAAAIVVKRLDALKKLGMLANLMHRRLTASQENLTLSYYLAGGASENESLSYWYRQTLAERRNEDIVRGSTSVGPHRDDLLFNVNGKDLRSFGSQGQQRTGILALKLAELEFIKSETGEYPVLLLDDVMSELDRQRREQLLSFIRDRIQTFITSTDATLFPEMLEACYYNIKAGAVVE